MRSSVLRLFTSAILSATLLLPLFGQDPTDERDLLFSIKLRNAGFSEMAERVEKRSGGSASSSPKAAAKLELTILRKLINTPGVPVEELRDRAEKAEAAQIAYVKTLNPKHKDYIPAEQDWIETVMTKGRILARMARQGASDSALKQANLAFDAVIKKYEDLLKALGPRPDSDTPEEKVFDEKERALLRALLVDVWWMSNDFYQHFKETHGALKNIFYNIVVKQFDKLQWYDTYLIYFEATIYVADVQMMVAAIEEPENREKNFTQAIQKFSMTKGLADNAKAKNLPGTRELVATAYKKLIQAYIKFGDIKKQNPMFRKAVDTANELLKKYPASFHKEELFVETQIEQSIAYARLGESKQAMEILNRISQMGGKWTERVKKVIADFGPSALPVPQMMDVANEQFRKSNFYKAIADYRSIINRILTGTASEDRKHLASCYFKLAECYSETVRMYEAMAAYSMVEEYKDGADKSILGKAAAKKMQLLDKIYRLTKNPDDSKKAEEFMDVFHKNYPEEFARAGLEMRRIETLEDQDKFQEAAVEASALVTKLAVEKKTLEPLYEKALWSQANNTFKIAKDVLKAYETEKDPEKKKQKEPETLKALTAANKTLYDYRAYVKGTNLMVVFKDPDELKAIKQKEAFSAFNRAWLNSRDFYAQFKNAPDFYRAALTLLADFEHYYKEIEGFMNQYQTIPARVHGIRISSYTALGDFDNAEKEIAKLDAYVTEQRLPEDTLTSAMREMAFRMTVRADELKKKGAELEKQAKAAEKTDPKKSKELAQASEKALTEAKVPFLKAAEYYSDLMDRGVTLKPPTVITIAYSLYDEAEELSNQKLGEKERQKMRKLYESAKRRFNYYLKATSGEDPTGDEERKKKAALEENIQRHIARSHTKLGEYDEATKIYAVLSVEDPKREKIYLQFEIAEFYEGLANKKKQDKQMDEFQKNMDEAGKIYGYTAGKFVPETWDPQLLPPKEIEKRKAYYYQSLYKWLALTLHTKPDKVFDQLPKFREKHSTSKPGEGRGWEEAAAVMYEGRTVQDLFIELEKVVEQTMKSLEQK